MAFLDFAATQYIRTLDTAEEVRMGSFQVVNNQELGHIRTSLYINGGDQITNEKIKIKIYSDNTYSHKLYESDLVSLSDITNLDTYWIGWLRFDFNRENINSKLTYYPTIATQDYTADFANDFYIGVCYDFPFAVYDNAEDLFYNHPLAMSIFGYKLT